MCQLASASSVLLGACMAAILGNRLPRLMHALWCTADELRKGLLDDRHHPIG
jgi:hypothetical protein